MVRRGRFHLRGERSHETFEIGVKRSYFLVPSSPRLGTASEHSLGRSLHRRQVIAGGAVVAGAAILPVGYANAQGAGLGSASDLTGAVQKFLATLDPERRKAASFPYGGPEWRGWNYFGASGYTKPGLRMEQLTAAEVNIEALAQNIADNNVKLYGLQGEIDRINREINALGAVNLAALDELTASRERKTFLDAQNADLQEAIKTLEDAIHKIDLETRDLLGNTFNQVNEHFGRMFPTLFGGGRAHLELVAAEDILESGIEIVAQPPGTKLKGITLLSGGQKTLTAVALLFALYMVKPSPFCLLDELDAPLDESNIGRFTDLLKKFVSESQFIIITHNKRTVSAASAIYGVTMEERGVSKTVSMRFNHERGEAETHAPNIAESVSATRPPMPVGA